jgi:hypothetical protein
MLFNEELDAIRESHKREINEKKSIIRNLESKLQEDDKIMNIHIQENMDSVNKEAQEIREDLTAKLSKLKQESNKLKKQFA